MLPGGIIRAGRRRRDYRFQPVTGRVELALAETDEAKEPLPGKVTRALAAALAEVAGEAMTPDLARELCVADRQFLMIELGARLGLEPRWETGRCAGCGQPFQFSVAPSTLPAKEAGDGYPFAEVPTSRGRIRFRVPSGEDQEAIAAFRPAEARQALVARCRVAGEGEEAVDPSDLDEAELAALDDALERASPAAPMRFLAPCPACGQSSEFATDPYACLRLLRSQILDEVHQLATSYHWSESEILALPRSRRRAYLHRIDRARGMVQ